MGTGPITSGHVGITKRHTGGGKRKRLLMIRDLDLTKVAERRKEKGRRLQIMAKEKVSTTKVKERTGKWLASSTRHDRRLQRQ